MKSRLKIGESFLKLIREHFPGWLVFFRFPANAVFFIEENHNAAAKLFFRTADRFLFNCSAEIPSFKREALSCGMSIVILWQSRFYNFLRLGCIGRRRFDLCVLKYFEEFLRKVRFRHPIRQFRGIGNSSRCQFSVSCMYILPPLRSRISIFPF